ncbi:MAG: SUMF1/EgtB/PvdO family nonheme iron enzyme [Leptolyngbya sp. SIOISBB]|nr:SUMF1/EgtB/PvdO family nonheme iron enzyme [Leptolyngbya sp. SIOISBB]
MIGVGHQGRQGIDQKSAGRVRRGGSWDDYPRNCRSAYRNFGNPGARSNYIGFRVVCSASRTQ